MKASVVLSFDDARKDNIKAFDEVLIPLKIPFTLNVTTGYVDGTLSRELWPTSIPGMSIEDVIRYSNNELCEIALHGDKHIGDKDDVLESFNKICSWIGNRKAIGFASPGCNQVFYKGLPDWVLYERIGINKEKNTLLKRVARRISKIIPSALLYCYSFSDSIMYKLEKGILYSATIFNETTVAQISRLIRSIIQSGGSIILQFHSIGFGRNEEDAWTWDIEIFVTFCQYICNLREQNKIQILTTMELINGLLEL